jgi:hypothetical protein
MKVAVYQNGVVDTEMDLETPLYSIALKTPSK